jgi:8-oxo-dGTP diphosphatase
LAESREYPARPFLAVGCIAIRDGSDGRDSRQVLLIQRGKQPSYGRWSIPGGAVEVGESLREAVAREVMEETGIEIDVGPIAEVVERVVRDDDGRVRFHYVIVDFAARYRAGLACPGDDSIGTTWADIDELAPYELAQQTVDVISKAARMLRDEEGAR